MARTHPPTRYPGDLDDAAVARSIRWGFVVGIPTMYLLLFLAVLAGGGSLSKAFFVPALPAVATGGFFGTLAVVDWAQHDHPVGQVRTLLHPRAAHQPHRQRTA